MSLRETCIGPPFEHAWQASSPPQEIEVTSFASTTRTFIPGPGEDRFCRWCGIPEREPTQVFVVSLHTGPPAPDNEVHGLRYARRQVSRDALDRPLVFEGVSVGQTVTHARVLTTLRPDSPETVAFTAALDAQVVVRDVVGWSRNKDVEVAPFLARLRLDGRLVGPDLDAALELARAARVSDSEAAEGA